MRALLLLLSLASPCSAKAIVELKVGDCYAYATVVATLAAYGETSTSPALVYWSGTAVETFISQSRRSLTTVEVYPSGLTCYRSFGDDWHAQPKNMVPG